MILESGILDGRHQNKVYRLPCLFFFRRSRSACFACWFLSSTLFSRCSLLQNFVRFVVLVRFYSTVHTAYIRNEAHDISKGARPNETNSNTGQYCTWRNCQPWWFDWRIEEWSDKSCSARRDRTKACAEDHPLLKMTDVTLTPHFGSATACTRMKVMELVVMNLRGGLNGEKLYLFGSIDKSRVS